MGLIDATNTANRILRRAAEYATVLARPLPDDKGAVDAAVRPALDHLRQTYLTTPEARERFALRLAFAEVFGSGERAAG